MIHDFKTYETRSVLHTCPVLAALICALLDAAPAAAQQACGSVTCGKGTRCETSSVDCVCPPGGESCDECDVEPVSFCTAAPCETNADCASYMVCAASSRRVCPDVAAPSCEPGESDDDCSARAEAWQAEQCDSVEQLFCMPRWERPCSSDADCGAGFRCEDSGACTLLVESCADTGDCPDAWTCQSVNSGPCVPPAGGSEDECIQTEQELRCIPPGGSVGVEEDAADRPGSGMSSVSDVPEAAGGATAPAALDGSSAGCSATGAQAPGSAAWLGGLLGLGLATAQRRRRQLRRAGH
jgi:MYXO-CTERM domain-containing protein